MFGKVTLKDKVKIAALLPPSAIVALIAVGIEMAKLLVGKFGKSKQRGVTL